MPLTISSDAFEQGGMIPSRFTCDGENLAPALKWFGMPAKAKSLVLIVDDPDAPGATWVHWVIVDLPTSSSGLPEGGAIPAGAREGLNDWGKASWGGPCPPSGTHRYFFKLYALDVALPALQSPTKAEAEAAMKAHVLEQAELMGRYARTRK